MDIANIAITSTLVGVVLFMAFGRVREQSRLMRSAEELKRSHLDFSWALDRLENVCKNEESTPSGFVN